jgi:hypothetical protein
LPRELSGVTGAIIKKGEKRGEGERRRKGEEEEKGEKEENAWKVQYFYASLIVASYR